MSINYSDFFIDYIDGFVDKTTVDKHATNGYKPFNPTPNLIFSTQNAEDTGQESIPYDSIPIDTISQINSSILTSKNIVSLDKEEVYDLISRLTIDDLSLFSPKIEIHRRLPSYMTLDSDKSNENSNYVYKKLDFVDGWSSYDIKNLTVTDSDGNQYYTNPQTNIVTDILNGNSGVGVAAITEASWQLVGSSAGLQGTSEIYDYLNKIGATVTNFNINFKFDSIATFFGNSQNNSELITNFLKDPKTYLQEMSDRQIEGNNITRNYAYLMFFGDMTADENIDNSLKPENNEEAYTFLISVGYSPLSYPISSILIEDSDRKERLTKFNSFLLQYPNYFNLVFKAFLSEYSFEFPVDNSINLKSRFEGNVVQGSLNEIFASRRPDFNYVSILEDMAVNSERATNPQLQKELNDARQIIKDNQQLLNEFEVLTKAGCLTGNQYSEQFKQKLANDLKEAKIKIQNVQEKSWSYFLTGISMHRIIQDNGGTVFEEWQNSIIDSQNSASVPQNDLRAEKLRLVTLEPIDKYTGKTQAQIELDPQKIKDEASSGQTKTEIYSTTQIPFFFFGDLVNNTVENFKQYHNRDESPNKNKYDDIYVTMPNVQIYQRTIKENQFGTKSRIKNINAAYIPISTYLFRSWVYKNIIVKQRQYYHLFDILNDFKLLLTEAINYKTDEIVEKEPTLRKLKGQPLNYVTFYNTSFEVNDNSVGVVKTATELIHGQDKIVFNGIEIPDESSTTDAKKIIYLSGFTKEILFSNSELLQNIYQNTITEEDQSTTKITSAGDYSKDMKLGIVHFFIGNQLGLAKTFSFNSGPPPNTKEQQTINEKRTNTEVRSIRYNDVEIKIVGGNFFRPTEIIYVHPHYSFGEPFDKKITMSNILNIGGYYQIIEINSNFTSNGKYETTLKAKFLIQAQAQGKEDRCGNKISPFFQAKYDEFANPIREANARAVKAYEESGVEYAETPASRAGRGMGAALSTSRPVSENKPTNDTPVSSETSRIGKAQR